jgi:uncharacterized protein (TIGR02246 family)
MRKIVIVLGIISAGMLPRAVNSDEGQTSAAHDEQAIRQTVTAYANAFDKGDLDALAAVWAPDAEYISEKGTVTKGRAAIANLFKQYMGGLKGARMAFKVTSIRPLTADVVMQDGLSTLTRADGSTDDGRFTAVWFKKDGKWLLRSVRDLPYEADDSSGAGGALKDLKWMIGDWVGEKEGISVSVRWAMNRSFLLQAYKMKGAEGEVEVQQLVGFDPLTGKLKSWTFDSLGGYGEGLWTRNGNSWVIETAGVLPNGQTGTAVNAIRFVDDQHAVFEARNREVGGQPIADSEVKLARKPSERSDKAAIR